MECVNAGNLMLYTIAGLLAVGGLVAAVGLIRYLWN